jgi:uncharacterized protein
LKRKLITKLLEWKEANSKEPLLLLGARGVGKTYLAYDFAKTFYTGLVYINFERETSLYDLICKNSNEIDDFLNEKFHLTENSNEILVILDEIHACPDIKLLVNILTKSNANSEYIRNISILCISSHFDDFYCKDEFFHKVILYPLDFEEFLISIGKEWYIEVITFHYNSNKKIPDIVHQELLSLFDLYLQVGGMPLAVNEYINTETIINVPEQHEILVNSFLTNVNKTNSESETLKINQVFSVLDKQLSKENKKFQYTLIRKGATGAMYSDALHYLNSSFYGIRCNKIDDESIYYTALNKDDLSFLRNQFYEDGDNKGIFKQYILDVGILNSSMRPNDDLSFESVRKGIFENYIALCLKTNGYPLYFWESNSQAKIDFLITKNEQLIPIEVRVNDNTRSKNISVFKAKHEIVTESIKFSTKNFEYSKNVKYVPIYAAFCI